MATRVVQSNQRSVESVRKAPLVAQAPASRPELDDVQVMEKKHSSDSSDGSRSNRTAEQEQTLISDEDDEREERDERGQCESTEVEDDEPEPAPFEVHALRARCHQLQDDVEVLAAHLEAQTLEREKERSAMRLLQNQLQHANMELARELHSFRIENDALRRQNALLQTQRDELEEKATLAAETQDELLLALTKQQQTEAQLQHANVLIVRERAHVRKALEMTQNHCRRLEEELAAAQTHLMQLQCERTALEVAATATDSSQLSREAEQIKLQDEMISSLRADLLQMEFEYKTLALDRETINDKLVKLQQRVSGGRTGSDAYDVIPLDKPLNSKQQQRQLEKDQREQTKQQQKQTKKMHIRPVRSVYESENGGFSGVMELPNFVSDRRESSSASSNAVSDTDAVSAAATALRRRSSFSSLVSKTVSSTRKRFFAPSSSSSQPKTLPS